MENNIIYDVISYIFYEEDMIPLGQDLYGDIDLISKLIISGNHQDMISVSESQEGICLSIRNTIGINKTIVIPYTKEWQRQDLLGQYSQYKTLVINPLMGNV